MNDEGRPAQSARRHHLEPRSSSLSEAAVEFVSRGFFPFPLRGKEPATSRGFYAAVGTPDEARDLFRRHPWASGVGIDCGRSHLVVADLDGPIGASGWQALCQHHGGVPETLIVLTGRSDGGRHLWFRTEGEPPRSKRLAPKLDTRAAGGYVAAPPSRHPSGRLYTWGNRLEPAPAPTWLLELLAPPLPPVIGERRVLPPGERITGYGRRALEGLYDEMAAAVEGARNDTLRDVSRRAGRLEAAGELDAADAESVLKQGARSTGLSQHEVDATWKSCFPYGQRYPAARRPR